MREQDSSMNVLEAICNAILRSITTFIGSTRIKFDRDILHLYCAGLDFVGSIMKRQEALQHPRGSKREVSHDICRAKCAIFFT